MGSILPQIELDCLSPETSLEPTAGTDTRPHRRTLLGRWCRDALLTIAITFPFGMPAAIECTARGWHSIERFDVWQFASMPNHHRALEAWGATQADLRSFHVEPLNFKDRIVLRYLREESRGVLVPNWEALGYTQPKLLSSDFVAVSAYPWPRGGLSWLCTLLGSLAALVVLARRLRRASQQEASIITLQSRPAAGSWRRMLLILLVSLALEVILRCVLQAVPTPPPDTLDAILSQIRGWARLPLLCHIVLVGPALEEALFRGLLFARFRAHGYVWSGALLSALLFALLHNSRALMPHYFYVGLVLAWLSHRAGSLWPPFALHSAWNALAFVKYGM